MASIAAKQLQLQQRGFFVQQSDASQPGRGRRQQLLLLQLLLLLLLPRFSSASARAEVLCLGRPAAEWFARLTELSRRRRKEEEAAAAAERAAMGGRNYRAEHYHLPRMKIQGGVKRPGKCNQIADYLVQYNKTFHFPALNLVTRII